MLKKIKIINAKLQLFALIILQALATSICVLRFFDLSAIIMSLFIYVFSAFIIFIWPDVNEGLIEEKAQEMRKILEESTDMHQAKIKVCINLHKFCNEHFIMMLLLSFINLILCAFFAILYEKFVILILLIILSCLVTLSTGFALFKIYDYIEDILQKLNLKFKEAIDIGFKYLYDDDE